VLSRLRGGPSALLVPVEGIGLEPPADNGLPPHVTVLFPFARPRAGLADELEETLGAFPAFDFALTAIGRFPGVLYLAPEPAAPFVALTEACVARWPEHPPYGGAYDETIPHVTLAEGDEPPGLAEPIARALPLRARASEVWLMAPGPTGRWRRRAVVALSGSSASPSR
jgi:2'-5' RNA ligase